MPLLGLLELLLRLESLLRLELLLSLLWLPCWLLRLELGSICVELEVLVSGVGWVDERISLGLLELLWLRLELLLLGLELEAGCWQLLAPWLLSCGSRSLSWCWALGGNRALGNRSPRSSNSPRSWSGGCLLRFWRETSLCRDLRVKGRRLKAGGSSGNVVALEDSEAILARGVLHSDRLAVVVDVAVLADPLTVGGDLLPGDGAILLRVRRPEPSIAGVEPLLFQNLGTLAVLELSAGPKGQTRQYYLQLKQFNII